MSKQAASKKAASKPKTTKSKATKPKTVESKARKAQSETPEQQTSVDNRGVFKSGSEVDLSAHVPAPYSISWLDQPAKHDYDAAANYLSLLIEPLTAVRIIDKLTATPTTTYKAKDILRASGLPLLTDDDEGVARELAEIAGGIAISPILLIRGDRRLGIPLMIADGYHRMCASYHVNENQIIPVRIVDA